MITAVRDRANAIACTPSRVRHRANRIALIWSARRMCACIKSAGFPPKSMVCGYSLPRMLRYT
jgi:hypothetical protein